MISQFPKIPAKNNYVYIRECVRVDNVDKSESNTNFIYREKINGKIVKLGN